MSSTAEQIKALPIGSVIVWNDSDEGPVSFMKVVVSQGETAEEATEVAVWVAPNMMTFDEQAFTGADAPLDEVDVVYTAAVRPAEDAA